MRLARVRGCGIITGFIEEKAVISLFAAVFMDFRIYTPHTVLWCRSHN